MDGNSTSRVPMTFEESSNIHDNVAISRGWVARCFGNPEGASCWSVEMGYYCA